MKVLITGANGMLGQDVTALLEKKGYLTENADREDLDICDLNAVLERVSLCKPNVIINCAAYTNVDGCETDVDNAYKGNAVGPKNLAIASNKFDVPLVHVSTDYLFDGEMGKPYIEGDVPNPLSVYGKSKLFGEQNVTSLTNKYFILRTQWLYGKNGKNFVKTMLELAEKNSSLKVVNDQFGSPTYTKDLAEIIYEIIQTESYGIYHTTNSGSCSWYEFTKDIMELAGKNVEVNPCTTDQFPRPAKRPKYSVLENFNLKINGFTQPRHYKDALKEYLSE